MTHFLHQVHYICNARRRFRVIPDFPRQCQCELQGLHCSREIGDIGVLSTQNILDSPLRVKIAEMFGPASYFDGDQNTRVGFSNREIQATSIDKQIRMLGKLFVAGAKEDIPDAAFNFAGARAIRA